jgi:hypothetical protein
LPFSSGPSSLSAPSRYPQGTKRGDKPVQVEISCSKSHLEFLDPACYRFECHCEFLKTKRQQFCLFCMFLPDNLSGSLTRYCQATRSGTSCPYDVLGRYYFIHGILMVRFMTARGFDPSQSLKIASIQSDQLPTTLRFEDRSCPLRMRFTIGL